MLTHMNLLKALAAVSSMTLLSRILGLVRELLSAYFFGATAAWDAFLVAFRLPNLLRRLFAEGAFSQAFVPVLAEYRTRRGEAETKHLVDHVATGLFMAVAMVAAIGVIATPLVIWVTAPGFADDPDKFELTVQLTRIMFPYIVFTTLMAFAAGILNTWSRFALPAFSPVMLNVAMIGGMLAAPHVQSPATVLAWTVILGGLLQLAIMLPALARIGMFPAIGAPWRDAGVRRILKLMAPAVLGVSVSQISLLINTVFASFLQTGSVSWLSYADRLMEFPAALLGVALGTILLPSLSKTHANGEHEEFSALLDWGLRLTLILTLPAALALALLAVPMLSTLFQHGAFTGIDVLRTQEALVAYSIGLTGLILVKVLAPGFYSRQDIKTPVKIALITLTATQLMNLLFIFGLNLAHAGLALSIGLASCLNAALLYSGLRRRQAFHPLPGWGSFSIRLLLALAVLATVMYFGAGDPKIWMQLPSSQRVFRLSVLVAAGSVAYLGSLWLLGFRLSHFKRRAA